MKRIRDFATLIWQILRELGDERAYERHLASHGRKHSRREWQEFSKERLQAKYIRPKCC